MPAEWSLTLRSMCPVGVDGPLARAEIVWAPPYDAAAARVSCFMRRVTMRRHACS